MTAIIDKSLEKARSLWAELGDIPVDKDMCIEESFRQFPVGTDLNDIWHWFEDFFDCEIGNDLQGH